MEEVGYRVKLRLNKLPYLEGGRKQVYDADADPGELMRGGEGHKWHWLMIPLDEAPEQTLRKGSVQGIDAISYFEVEATTKWKLSGGVVRWWRCYLYPR